VSPSSSTTAMERATPAADRHRKRERNGLWRSPRPTVPTHTASAAISSVATAASTFVGWRRQRLSLWRRHALGGASDD
jgi:hypothetical protein